METILVTAWVLQLVVVTAADPNKPGRAFLIFAALIGSSVVTILNCPWYWILVPMVVIMTLAFFIKGVLRKPGVKS